MPKRIDLSDVDVERLRGVVGIGEQKPAPEIPVREAELFVKIDEHRAVAEDLINAKKDIKAITDTLDLLAKSEQLKEEVIQKLENSLNVLDKKLENIELKLTPPQRIASEVAVPTEIADLHEELEALKNHLKKI